MTPSQSLSVSTPTGIQKITPRVLKAVERMVFFGERRAEAARTANIADITLRRALAKPHVRQHYQRQLVVLRESEQARNLKVACDIREDAKAAPRSRIEAMKFIEPKEPREGSRLQINVGVNVQPGYIVDIGQHRSEAAHILQLSGSVKNVLDDQ